MLNIKTCTKCNEPKLLIEFHKQISNSSGYRPQCKYCRSTSIQKDVENGYRRCSSCKLIKLHDEFVKHILHKDGISSKCKSCKSITDEKYRKNNKEKIKDFHKAHYQANKERIKLNTKFYRTKNKVKINKAKSRYRDRRIKNNVNYKLSIYIRNRICSAIKGKIKAGSAVKNLGCTIDEFKLYIEKKFQDGMTWHNHGTAGWHLDHIMPLSFFDLTDTEQFLKACNYTNYQPLWASDNLSKGNKLNWSNK